MSVTVLLVQEKAEVVFKELVETRGLELLAPAVQLLREGQVFVFFMASVRSLLKDSPSQLIPANQNLESMHIFLPILQSASSNVSGKNCFKPHRD